MKHLTLIEQFREELTRVSRQIEIAGAMGYFDINKVCEDVFCALFKELYEFSNIRNLNAGEQKNFPGVDLADDVARVAIQITSDKSLEKIKESIGKFLKHSLDERYDRIIFYVLTRKQNSYSVEALNKACDNKIEFDPSRDILDFTDLATKAASVSPACLKKAVDVLGTYTRGCDVGLADQDFDPPGDQTEVLDANLMELYFPKKLYIAELNPEVFEGRKSFNQRKCVGDYVRNGQRR